jgi:hypothetical protein
MPEAGQASQKDRTMQQNELNSGPSACRRSRRSDRPPNRGCPTKAPICERTLKNGEVQNTQNFVTNIYEKKDGQWLIVSHHAHPIPQ